MPSLIDEITQFIQTNISSFYDTRLRRLQGLNLKNVLRRKNPYLFKAKYIYTAADLVKGILDAHLSSQEETIFGAFLERLAIFICQRTFNGKKSAAEGIDLEFEKDQVLYLVAIKSGPNWGNSGQISKMKDNFRKAKRILGTNANARNVIAVNGCCYGQTLMVDQGEYLKLCGEQFWNFISDIPTLYVDIIEPLGHDAKTRNAAFEQEYAKVQNRFIGEFISNFCAEDGQILWPKLVEFNSGKVSSSNRFV
jgi:hypothetical protein